MTPRLRLVVAAVATTLFALAYVLPAALELPQLWYLPLERTWRWGARPAPLAMALFGRALGASLAACLGGGAALVLLRDRPPPTARSARILLWIAAAAIAFAAGWCLVEAGRLGADASLGLRES